MVDERRVKRNERGHGADQAAPCNHGDLAPDGEARLVADVEGVPGGDNEEVGRVAESRRERWEIEGLELELERSVAGERGGAGLRGVHPLLVGGERRAQAGLEARVDP